MYFVVVQIKSNNVTVFLQGNRFSCQVKSSWWGGGKGKELEVVAKKC